MNVMRPFKKTFFWAWLRFVRLLIPFGKWIDKQSPRGQIAYRYLKGAGLEIGALHRPLLTPAGVNVEYVDRLSNPELAKHYDEFEARELVHVTHIDDGMTLETVPDTSKDFVIACHIIEHMEDPVEAIKNWLRVVKPGGIVYIIIPDKRHTFDHQRPVTTEQHVIRDHKEGPECSHDDHYREWTRYVVGVPEDQIDERAGELIKQKYSIHFHVWTPMSFLPLLYYCREHYPYDFNMELLRQNGNEFIIILKKHGTSST